MRHALWLLWVVLCGCSTARIGDVANVPVTGYLRVAQNEVAYHATIENQTPERIEVFDNFACMCGFEVRRTRSIRDNDHGGTEDVKSYTVWSSSSTIDCQFCEAESCPSRWVAIAPGEKGEVEGVVQVEDEILRDLQPGDVVELRSKVCGSARLGASASISVMLATREKHE